MAIALACSLYLFPSYDFFQLKEDEELSYSFKVPEIPGEQSTINAGCCKYIEYTDNYTDGLAVPTLIGIGTEKSGSTYLSSLLQKHPNIEIAKKKEMHFLDSSRVYHTMFRDYLRGWATNTETKNKKTKSNVLFEMTPNYMFVPFAACRAKVHMPNAKFVLILRDPAERAYSQYTMFRNRHKRGSIKHPWRRIPFDEVIREGIAKLQIQKKTFSTGIPTQSWNDAYRCVINAVGISAYCQGRWYMLKNGPDSTYEQCQDFPSEMVARGLYGPQLAWWFNFFKPEQFLIINAIDLFEDPLSQLNRVADFVGLDQPFTENMIRLGINHGMNKGSYFKGEDAHITKKLLRQFYDRPNKELYQLLRQYGHNFRMFGDSKTPEVLRDILNFNEDLDM